jgi:hypothetical protein
VAALAADPDVMRHRGGVLVAAAVARDYGFTDVDGKPKSSNVTSVCTKSSPLKRRGSPVEVASAYEKQSP